MSDNDKIASPYAKYVRRAVGRHALRAIIVVACTTCVALVASRSRGARRLPWIGYPSACVLAGPPPRPDFIAGPDTWTIECRRRQIRPPLFEVGTEVAYGTLCDGRDAPVDRPPPTICTNEAGILVTEFDIDSDAGRLVVPDNGRVDRGPITDLLAAAAAEVPIAAWGAWMLFLSGLFVLGVPRFYPTSRWVWLVAALAFGWAPFVYTAHL